MSLVNRTVANPLALDYQESHGTCGTWNVIHDVA